MERDRMKQVALGAAGMVVIGVLVTALVSEFKGAALPAAGGPAEEQQATRRDAAPVTNPAESGSISPRAFVDSSTSAPSVESRGAPDRDHDLHGRVLDPSGQPVAGAPIAVVRNEARDVGSVLDLEYGRAERPIGATTTDDAGAFRVRLARGRAVDLVVTAEGHPKTRVRNRYAGEFVEIRLQKAAGLVGTITQASDQAPVPGVKLRAFRLGEPGTLFQGATNAMGQFEFTGLEPGAIVLEVAPPEHLAPPWANLRLTPGQTLRNDFALQDGPTVSGIVTDAATGAPISGAEVGEGWTFFRPVITGSDGRWVFRGVGEGRGEIHARAQGFGRKSSKLPRPIPSKLEVAIALERGRPIRGRVVTAARIPVPSAYVAAVSSTSVGGSQEIDWPSTRTGPEGRFEIADARRDIPHAIFIRKEGLAATTFDLPPTEKDSDAVELGDLVIDEGATVSGLAVDTEDRPLPDVAIRLSGDNGDRFKLWKPDERRRSAADDYLASHATRSDDLGRFRFSDVATGEYLVARAEQADGDTPVFVSVRAGASVDGLKLVLRTPITIAGRVQRQGGGRIPLCEVSAYFESAETKNNRMAGVLTSGDGEFELKRLKEGAYTLVVRPIRQGGDAGEALAPTTVTGVRSGTRDVRVTVEPSTTITGTVLDHAGKPLKEALIVANDAASGFQLVSVRSAEDGTFTLDLGANTSVKVTAMAPVYGDGRVTSWRQPGIVLDSVRAGTRDLVLTLPPPP